MRISDWSSDVCSSDLGAQDFQNLTVVVNNVSGLSLTAASGGSTLIGQGEEDTLRGAGGNDTLIGNGGSDTLNGAGGNANIAGGAGADRMQNGRESWRERGCQYVEIPVGCGSLKKQKKHTK